MAIGGNVTVPGHPFSYGGGGGNTYEVPGLSDAQAAEINNIILNSGLDESNVQNIAPGGPADGEHPLVIITLNNTGGPSTFNFTDLGSNAIVVVSDGSYNVTFDPGIFFGGDGEHNITFTGAGNDTVNTDHGDDTVTLPATGDSNLTLLTKGNATIGGAEGSHPNGNDNIYIWGAGDVTLGNGNDTVVIKNYGASDTITSSLTLGTGNHLVTFLGNGEIQSAGNDTITLGSGNDTVVETGSSTTSIDSDGNFDWHGYLYGAGQITQTNAGGGETVTGTGAFKIGQVYAANDTLGHTQGEATGTELSHTGTGGGTIEFNSNGSHTYVFDSSQGGGRDYISGFNDANGDRIDLTNYAGAWDHNLIHGKNGDSYIKLTDGTVIEIHGTIAQSDITGG